MARLPVQEAGQVNMPIGAAMPTTIYCVARSSAPTQRVQQYDRRTHRWNPGYVFPRYYTLHLYLSDIAATFSNPINWTIDPAGRGRPSLFVTDSGLSGIIPGRQRGVDVEVPGPGVYNLTAKWKTTTITSTYDLRDFCIVSIGDSFSSGQGNPDQPGVPNPAASALCELTTLKKLVETFSDLVDEIPVIDEAVDLVVDAGGLLEEGFGWIAERATGSDVTPHMEKEPVWMEPLAWRSGLAAPFQAAQASSNAYGGNLVTFISVAQSGAEVEAGLLRPQRREISTLGQIAEAARTLGSRIIRDHRGGAGAPVTTTVRLRRAVDVLIMSIGGNDVGFSGTLSDMTSDSSFIGLLKHGQAGNRQQIVSEVEKRINGLPAKYDRLAAAIQDQLKPKNVLVLTYPLALFDDSSGKPAAGCGLFDLLGPIEIDQQDAAELKKLGEKLNKVIADAATKHNWTLVTGIAEDFEGHGYCSGSSWFVFAEQSCKRQDDLEGTMHPNTAGTTAVADRITTAVKPVLAHLRQTDPAAGTWR